MRNHTLAFVLGALTLVGCGFPKAGTVPGPITPAAVQAGQARWQDSSEASLQRGRELFVGHCNACHSFPDINAYADDKWPEIMKRMGKKADLSPADTELVLRFVQATRTPGAASAAK